MNFKIEGSGKTLVFIHGLSDNLSYWEFFATNLKHNYQVLRIDLPGHGQSELEYDNITIDTYVNDLNNILKELNISKVNIIGFSLGSAVGLEFTIKYPKKVESLVLMSSFYKANKDLKIILNSFKTALDNSFEEFYELILPMVLCPKIIEDNKKELDFLKNIASQNANTKAYIKAIDVCLNFNAEKYLSKINVPVLILAGLYDEISTLNMQRLLCDKIKNSKLIVFENMKHNLLVGENNEKILNILIEFLPD